MTRQIPLSIFSRNIKPELEKANPPVVKKKDNEKPAAEAPVLMPEPTPVPQEPSAVSADPIPESVKTETEPVAEEPATEKIETEETKAKETVPSEEVISDKTDSEKPEEDPKEEKPKRKRTTSKKSDEPDVVSVSNKMTGASKLPDAVALVVPEYEDPEYDEWKEYMKEALLHTVFDERADAGVIKVILSNLARAYDNATQQYAKVSANLEIVSNKSYGLIMRQTAANSIGTNDADRKRNGLHAPEVYKTSGKTVNLFAIEAGLRKQATEIQMIIKQIEFKKSAIIAYLTAEKIDAGV